MPRKHKYETRSTWTGDRGEGTADYRAYGRTYDTTTSGREPIRGSSDPAFRGDADRCAVNGVVVTAYEDVAEGVMVETPDGGGHFEDVVLRPVVTVAAREMVERAQALHEDASAVCFIASSVNFPVRHEPQTAVRGEPQK